MIADAISWALLLGGSFFLIVGAVGLVRLPEVFSRMHAAGVTDTGGAGLILLGLMVQGGLTLVTVKLFFILVFLWFTSPTACHALAKAAIHNRDAESVAPTTESVAPTKP
jgi:multicomponent Na+:H+ antiporter subunit G